MKNDYLQSDTFWIVISDPLVTMISIRYSLSFRPNRRPSIIQVLTYLSKMKVLAELFSSAQLFSGNSISKLNKLLPPANEVCEGYVFTRACHSVHKGGGVVSQHALQVVSQHALLQVSWLGGVPACLAGPWGGGLQAHTQGGVEGSGQSGGGLQAHTQGVSRPTPGGSQHALRQTPPTPVDSYCRGWYASYWNAFLFQIAMRYV